MKDPIRLNDGFTSLEGGMDGGTATNLVPRNKVSFAMNATMRGGYVNNRPGWNNLPITFPDQETQDSYSNGVFQGAGKYIPDDGDPFWFVSVSGHIYRAIIGATGVQVEDLTPAGDPNMSTLPYVWMCQADSFMVIQDGVDAPFVYDGNGLRRSNIGPNPSAPAGTLPKNQPGFYEVPTGTAMAYGYGRLFLEQGKEVIAGDITDASISDSAIRFTEILQFEDGFAIPVTSGSITALVFGADIDTSIGQGPLQVHTSSGQVVTINVTVDRQAWTTTTDIQNIGLFGGAALGQNAVVNVNNDTWFRSFDGLRSFVVARRQFNTWGNTAQSRELNDVLSYDTPDLLAFASGVWFDNRLLITTSPQRQNGNTFFQGLAVLDFDLLTVLNRYSGSIYDQNPAPAYDGFWQGINICQISKGFFTFQERCFIFAWNATEGNQIWELTTSSEAAYNDNGNCPILSWIETGSYNFNDLTRLKKLVGADLWIDQMQGMVNFDFSWLPEQYPFWLPWESFTQSDGSPCAATPATGPNPYMTCQVPINNPLQYRSRLRMQEPEIDPQTSMDSPETEYPLNCGYDFRIRIQWKGRARLKGLRCFGALREEETTGRKP